MRELFVRAARALAGSGVILKIPAPPGAMRLSYGDDPYQFGDLRLPAGSGPHAVVIVIHGGFWRARYDLEHIGHLCAAITQTGFATWSIEYRRLGNPGGGWPGTLLDTISAVNHLRYMAAGYPLDLDRIVVIGHSAGGHLALWLGGAGKLPAESPPVNTNILPVCGMISLAGVCDLRRAWELALSDNAVEEFIGGSPRTFPERYAAASPVEMSPMGGPQILIHGVEDDIVPLEISQRYLEAANERGDDVTLVALPGIGHFELIDPYSPARPQVLRAIQSMSVRNMGV